MKKRGLGATDLMITPMGLGTWAIGGPWKYGWGKQNNKDSIKTIRKAVELGINWIDTAPAYGVGHAEEIIAQALKEMPGKPLIFTKCGFRIFSNGHAKPCLKSSHIRQEVEDSLRRLNIDVIDLYQIHWPLPAQDIREAWETLVQCRDEGKIRHIGVSNFNLDQLKEIADIQETETLQPPFNPAQRSAENDLFPYCRKKNIGTLVYSPMASGLFTGKMDRERIKKLPENDWRRKSPMFQEPLLSKNLAIAEVLKDIAKERETVAGVIALAWAMGHEDVTGVITGMRKAQQVEELIEAAETTLSKEESDRIDSL